jgi:hypothetical protein
MAYEVADKIHHYDHGFERIGWTFGGHAFFNLVVVWKMHVQK